MTRSRRAVALFAASAAVAVALASVVAHADETDSDSDSVSDVIEAATQRSVAATSSQDELNITSRLVSEPFEDEFGVSYKAGTFRIYYERPGGGGSEYELELRSLFEWVDSNGDGRVDGGERFNSVSLGSSAFGTIPVLHRQRNDTDGGRVHFFTIRSDTGQITLNLTVSSRFMRLSEDRILTPMEVKMDVVLTRPVIDPGVNLGLEMRMDTPGRVDYADRSWYVEHGFAANEASMAVAGDPPGAPARTFFSWSKTSVSEDREIPVSVSSSPGSGPYEYDLYMIYHTADQVPVGQIVHDPSFGVESAAYQAVVSRPPPLRADITLYAVALAAFAALVGTTIAVANRRRRKRGE